EVGHGSGAASPERVSRTGEVSERGPEGGGRILSAPSGSRTRHGPPPLPPPRGDGASRSRRARDRGGGFPLLRRTRWSRLRPRGGPRRGGRSTGRSGRPPPSAWTAGDPRGPRRPQGGRRVRPRRALDPARPRGPPPLDRRGEGSHRGGRLA